MKIQITLTRSLIGQLPKHRRTVEALGLRKINSKVVREKNDQTMGIVRAISHMIRVEELE